MKKVVFILLSLLPIGVFGQDSTEVGVVLSDVKMAGDPDEEEEEYPSRQADKYFDQRRYKPFKPETISFVKSIKYEYVQIREIDTKNKFITVWEESIFNNHYDSLHELCVDRWRIDYAAYDSLAEKKYSDCLEAIEKQRRAKKIADIYYALILRYDSIGDRKVILYRDSELEERNFGYWIAISDDNGQSWKKYYTGLVENHFYFLKPNPKIRLIKNKSTIQVEAALVRKIVQETLPVGAPEFELVKDNLVLEIDLDKVMADSDQDGLTDIMETKFFTNPLKNDTDGDGIDDLTDRNPRYKNVANKYSILYRNIVENNGDSIVYFVDRGVSRDQTENIISKVTLIITDDPNLLHLTGTIRQYIILTTKEFKKYKKKNYVPLEDLGVSPLFEINNKPGLKKIHITGSFWGTDYLIIEKENYWIIRGIGGYII